MEVHCEVENIQEQKENKAGQGNFIRTEYNTTEAKLNY